MQLSKRYILEKAYYSLKILLHNILVLTLFHNYLCFDYVTKVWAEYDNHVALLLRNSDNIVAT